MGGLMLDCAVTRRPDGLNVTNGVMYGPDCQRKSTTILLDRLGYPVPLRARVYSNAALK